MEAPGNTDVAAEDGVGAVTKNSTFGEAEVEDMTAW
jgi:homoserine O-acetyltransferase